MQGYKLHMRQTALLPKGAWTIAASFYTCGRSATHHTFALCMTCRAVLPVTACLLSQTASCHAHGPWHGQQELCCMLAADCMLFEAALAC